MAQKVQTLFIDDIDGSEADGTVRFGLDGTDYEIDLNTTHADGLRKSLEKYISVSRKAPGSARRGTRVSRRAATSSINTTEVREWAKGQGYEVKERGRIPGDVVAKYREATGK